jgi:hypothetical protein
MPKTAVIEIRHAQAAESFIRKVARWNTIFTEETGHLRIHNIEYVYNSGSTVNSIERMVAQEGLQLRGVSSLDTSVVGRTYVQDCVFRGLALMCPNLMKLNISGPSGDICFFELCPNLTNLTWSLAGGLNFMDGMDGSYRTPLDLKGSFFRMAATLRELYLEDSVLLSYTGREIDPMIASEPMEEQVEGDSWLLCECPSPLERIDLRGVTYFSGPGRRLPIPQKALVKLVRRSRNLKWLRSELSKENIAMLQLERLDLTFLST